MVASIEEQRINLQRQAGLFNVYGLRRRLSFMEWIRSLGRWRYVGGLGIWRYEENEITGQRRAVRLCSLMGPVHSQWLLGGAWEQQRPAPPPASNRKSVA